MIYQTFTFKHQLFYNLAHKEEKLLNGDVKAPPRSLGIRSRLLIACIENREIEWDIKKSFEGTDYFFSQKQRCCFLGFFSLGSYVRRANHVGQAHKGSVYWWLNLVNV